MKRLLFILLLTSFFKYTSFSQTFYSRPSLSKLMEWSNQGYSRFSSSAKTEGFEYNGKTEKKGQTTYKFIRNSTKNGISYPESLHYIQFEDSYNTVYILFSSRITDLDQYYADDFDYYDFSKVKCNSEFGSKREYCYKNGTHEIMFLHEYKPNDNIKDVYTISVSKL